MSTDYLSLQNHYEACLRTHGDMHKGVDWPNAVDADTRYRIMAELMSNATDNPVELLDYACGAGHFFEYLRRHGYEGVHYHGHDISEQFITLCRRKYPETAFTVGDALQDKTLFTRSYDYVIINGLFTVKGALPFDAMFAFLKLTIHLLYPLARKGLAFNVMSTHVDWTRDDLFHLPLDTLAEFLSREISRHFVIRNDYGLYEYTVYLYPQAFGDR